MIAVGYSNGANIAASLILLHPHYFAAAVLFRAMVPFTPDIIRDFSNLSVFISAGDRDPIVPRSQPVELAGIVRTRPRRRNALLASGRTRTRCWGHLSR